jgi:hypothetical protein
MPPALTFVVAGGIFPDISMASLRLEAAITKSQAAALVREFNLNAFRSGRGYLNSCGRSFRPDEHAFAVIDPNLTLALYANALSSNSFRTIHPITEDP